MNYELLVNKDNPIQDDDLPKQFTVIGINEHPTISFGDSTNEILLESTAANFFQQMISDVNSRFENKIIPDSGYRSVERQEKLLQYYIERDGEKAYSFVALPRTSEHHTGLAIDVAMIKDDVYCDDITGDEPEIMELEKIAYQYGFILRYPKNKSDKTGYTYEPWHFRFVGLDLAKVLHDNDITLDEYHSFVKDNFFNKNL